MNKIFFVLLFVVSLGLVACQQPAQAPGASLPAEPGDGPASDSVIRKTLRQ